MRETLGQVMKEERNVVSLRRSCNTPLVRGDWREECTGIIVRASDSVTCPSHKTRVF